VSVCLSECVVGGSDFYGKGCYSSY